MSLIESHKRRILIVDDAEGLVRLVARLSCQSNTIVRVEKVCANAVATAVEFRPDVILVDFDSPPEQCSKIAGCIRANPALQRIPIVFLTDRAPEVTPDDQFFSA